MLNKFEWPKAEEEVAEIIIRNVRKHGCHIVGIPTDEQGPGYAFSIGLFVNYGHAELIVFGLERDDLANVINSVRDLIVAGRKFAAGDVCDDLLVESRIGFVETPFEVISNRIKLIPSCFFAAGSVRTRQKIQSACCASVVQVFCPLTM